MSLRCQRLIGKKVDQVTGVVVEHSFVISVGRRGRLVGVTLLTFDDDD